MRQYFISFSSSDIETAEQLGKLLEKEGDKAWICTRQEDNPVGGDWAERLARELNQCDAILFLCSSLAVKSKWVFREIEMAVIKDKPLLTIRLDKAELPENLDFYLRTLQFLDVSQNPEPKNWFVLLRRALNRLKGQRLNFPLDSVIDRQIKVDAVLAMADYLDCRDQFYLAGLSLIFDGLPAKMLSDFSTTKTFWHNCLNTSKEYAKHLSGNTNAGLIPIFPKEGNLFFVLVMPSKDELNHFLAYLNIIHQQFYNMIIPETISILVHFEQPRQIQYSNNETVSNFLTVLGDKDIHAKKNPEIVKLDVPYDEKELSPLIWNQALSNSQSLSQFKLKQLYTTERALTYLQDIYNE